MTPEEKKEFEEMKWFIKSLQASHSIPLAVDQSFRERLSDLGLQIAVSTKSSDSEDRTVNEGGVASYNVLKSPDAFLQVVVAGSVKYIPIFT